MPEGGSFPLSWLADAFRLPAALASVTGLPVQERRDPGKGGYVPTSETRANGGVGSPQSIVEGGLDGYRPFEPEKVTTTTGPQARGFVEETSKRQAGKSAAEMDQYLNADGSTTRIFSADPVNYRTADGKWQPIDPTLIRVGDRWRTRANSLSVTIGAPTEASPAPEANSATASPTPETSPAPSASPASEVNPASKASPAAEASPTPMASVAAGSDAAPEKRAEPLAAITVAEGIEAGWSLDGAAAVTPAITGATAAYPEILPGTDLELHTTATGFDQTLILKSPQAKAAGEWLLPLNLTGLTPHTAATGDVELRDDDDAVRATIMPGSTPVKVETIDGGRSLRMTADSAWLNDPARVFPLRLGVTVTTDADAVTKNTALTVPIDTTRPAGTHVTEARVEVAGCETDQPVTVTGADGRQPLGTATTCKADATVPLDEAAVDSALAKAKTKTADLELTVSAAAEANVVVTLAANKVPQIDTRYPALNAVVETLTPQLVTRAHDPDNSPAKGLTYAYTVYDTTATAVATSGTVTTSGWQVPAGKLAWNTSYYYTVKVGDTVGTTAESAVSAFATTVPQPRLTSDLAQNPGAGFDPNNGNYTTDATDAEVAGVGPALEISRSYNSLDTRRTGAFGQGWASILDTAVTERKDAAGAVKTVEVTYPNGSEVAFGRNADGTFTPPSGRFAVFTAQTSGTTVTGYTLTDKDATKYVFGRSIVTGRFGVTSIADANGRALTFAYDAGTGLISTMTNTSGRKLTLTWATTAAPTSGASHVASVVTDAPVAGGTGYTWTYTYGTYDRLTSVCPPGTSTACTVYEWANWHNQQANAVLDLNPYSFWRLNETEGTSAASSVLTNAGVDNGIYKNVTLGGAASLADSTSPTTGFNGTTSSVQLPGKLVNDGSYQSLSMWFKTSTAGGVLFSYSGGSISAGTTTGNYVPALYVDKNGFLRGEFWQGAVAPMKSKKTVTDGSWHHVVLSGAGNTQTMYVDGLPAADLAGTIGLFQTTGSAYEYVGAGFVGGSWPDHVDTGKAPAPARYFTGSIADVGFFTKTLSSSDVTGIYQVATNSSSAIRSVTSPAGKVTSQIAISTVSGQVSSVTDENGGVWTMGQPSIAGSSEVYVASVLGAKPLNYWRLGETEADTADAVNEVAGSTATYSSVQLGAAGPFPDSTAATFNGSTSAVALPGTVAAAGASSVGVWFNTTAAGKVVLGSQAGVLGTTTAPGLPTLWISADGRLRGLSPSTTPTGPLRSGIAGKCVNVTDGATANGTKVGIYTCNGAAAQNWTWYADGTVRALGKCLDAKSSGTVNGTLVQLYDCNNSVAQVWEPTTGGGLKNTNAGKCLDDPDSTTVNDTQLRIWTCNSTAAQQWPVSLASSAAVNDGKWHQAVLTSTGLAQVLYVDGVKAASSTGSVALDPGAQPYAYLGVGLTGTGWSGLTANTTSYYTGKLAEAAFFATTVTADQVAAQFAASKLTVPVAVTTVDTSVQTITMPVKTVAVTDPGGKTVSYAYDLVNNRQIAETDALGNTTRYGYDSGGFDSLVYDPNGVRTQNVQDKRGNTIQALTCQDQSANLCSSTYYGYYLNAADPVDPRNDLMVSSRDGRSADRADNTYRTIYDYDTKGNPVTTTDPLKRITATAYTDGTTIAAADGGFAPAGLPYQITNAANSVQAITYNANGDIAKTVSPAGEVTAYTYDRLGRKLSETVTTSTFPSGRTSTFTYDALGRVLTESDPPVTNRVTGAVHTLVATNVYDADGRMMSQSIADTTGGDVARTETVKYNDRGQRLTATDATGKSTSFTYDAYGQVVTETDSDGGVTAYVVDPEGHVLSETMKGWTGDPDAPQDPKDLITETNMYDPDGRLASTTDAMGRTTSYTYTDNDLTATVTVTDGTSSFVQERNTYDNDGNLETQITGNGATKTAFKYDEAGRQTITTLDPDGLNRVSTNEYAKDDNIWRTTQRVGTGEVLSATDHQYDTEGRMTAETSYNGDPASTPLARWKLDATTGTTAADSSGNAPGTANNGVTWSTSAPAGHTGSAAFNRDQKGRVTSVGGPVVDTTRSWTVSAWVYLTISEVRNFAAVSQDGPVRSTFMLGYAGTNNKWRMLSSRSSTAQNTVESQVTAATNTWTQLTGVYDSSIDKMSLYVNGEFQTTAGITGMASTGPFIIGGGKWDGGVSDSWPGQVADVQAYQGVLTADQIKKVYAGTAPAAGATVSRSSAVTDEGGLATRSIDPLGNATDVTYDEAERPVVTVAAPVVADTEAGTVTARPVTYTGYDTFGDETESVDANGNRTTTVFDRAGRAYETHDPTYTTPAGTTISPVSKVEYDTLGQAVSSTDELGNVTRNTFDQLGRTTRSVAPNGGITRVSYDLAGQPLTVTDPTGAVSATTYDFLGRQKTTTQAVRQTGGAYETKYNYDTAGRLESTTTPAGATEHYTYNAVGQPVTSVDPAGQTTTTAYDGQGLPVKVTQPDGTYQTTSYDMLSRPTAAASYGAGSTTPGTTSAQSYDAAGKVLTSTDGRGTTTSYTYDPTGLVLTEKQPISATASITTSFGYDLVGNRTRFTDGRGNAFRTTYNAWNLSESTIEPATTRTPSAVNRTWTITYDAAGQAVSQRAPGGVVQTYSYDSAGSLKSQSGTGAEADTGTRTFDYDLAGRVTSFATPTGSNTVGYDDRGLPLSITGASGNSSFTYTADGLMASRTDAAGTTAYTYDGADRLATLSNSAAGADLRYTYDTTSAVKKITYGGTGNVRTFDYDDLHRVNSDSLATAAGAAVAKISYGWDANGNETSKTTTSFGAGTTANKYTYDLADRLTSWDNGNTTVGYTYDASGNRTGNGSTTYTYDEQNRLFSDSTGAGYSYSPRGTLTSVAGNGTTTSYTSDAFDQTTGQGLSYDALGRAVRAGFSYTGTGNDLAGDGTATYARDPSASVISAGGRLTWTDLHDDVVGQFTPTGTTLTGSRTYDPLGKVVTETGMLGNLGYQSEYTEPSTGRVNMAARWYNPGTGQFDNRDTAANSPVPDSINANRYQYGDANPLTVTDPTGHWGFRSITSFVSRAASTVTSYASQAASVARSYSSSVYHATVSLAYSATAYTLHQVSKAAKKVGFKRLAKRADAGRKRYAKKARIHRHKAHRSYERAQRKGHALKQRAARAANKVAKKVNDATKRSVKWVKAHKKQIIAVVAVVAVVAATVALGPVGGIVAGIAINVAKDALLGEIHSIGDLASSAAMGAVTGIIGAATGGLGGAVGCRIAGMAATKLGAGFAGKVAAGAIDGGVTGGVSDAAEQLVRTGRIDVRQTAQAAAVGAFTGGLTRGLMKKSACHSFDPTTRIFMADGTVKQIGDVSLGDEVLSTDPESGDTEGKKVSVLHHHLDTDLAKVTVSDTKTGKRAVLDTTANHPFWSEDRQAWVEAKDLKPGERLRSADGESSQRVASVKLWNGLKWMDDLTVNDIHTYYVLAGNTPVLVHNNSGEPCKPPVGSRDSLDGAGKQSYDTLKAAVGRARGDHDSIRDNLGPNQVGRTDVPFFVQRMWAGTALEKAVAADPKVVADGNIVHVGASLPGRAEPDFVIGGSHNIDVTGASRTSISEHMGRDYYKHNDQLLTYPTLAGADIAKIFGKVGRG
ncbi:hypothetical protein Ahu01nite_084330 [Winogradskya humida]|uniref:Laminin G domain-containing protein n=1 Tax=Winogradskya humida TaxID=113566 RepID=A0ABQ4A3B5_9ACTN|nr:hypothetical protein Ahu01nite_084330 [Actinoplanes humidus]